MSLETRPDQGRELPGMAVFGAQRAEDEPWLAHCFVPPNNFASLRQHRSLVVFGRSGSGKTALCRALQEQSHTNEGKPARLLVNWKPSPVKPAETAGSGWVYQQVAQVFDACAYALLQHLARYPADFRQVPEWAQSRLTWFVHNYLQGEINARLGPLLANPTENEEALQDILNAVPGDILHQDAAPDQVMAELISALRPLQLDGVWIMSDELEGWLQTDQEGLANGLKAFLSTLSLFERAGLAYKLFVPSRLEPTLSRVSGVLRRRVDAYHLRWTASELRRIVNARLALALGQPAFTLRELCQAAGLDSWLEKTGADLPREWLDQVEPLLRHYLEQPSRQPLTEDTWQEIRRQRPPRLYLGMEGRRIMVGGREISLEDIPAKGYEMLLYLYERGGQVVGKDELYFRVYRGLDYTPRSAADEMYEAPKEYDNLIDTNIWRLRQAIEPNPKEPVLLITIRGHGLRLNVRW